MFPMITLVFYIIFEEEKEENEKKTVKYEINERF